MKSSNWALAALVATSFAVTGCGGGGGGEEPQAMPPLVMTATNAQDVAGLAPGIGDSVLTVAQFAVDSALRFAGRGSTSPSMSTCPNGGLLTVTLVDRDGDGIASAGDQVAVEARDCGVPVVTEIVTGHMQIDLTAVSGTPLNSLRAAVSLPSGLQFGGATTAALTLFGSTQVDWSSTVLQTALRVTASAADDLRAVLPGTTPLTESIRQPDLAKTLKYDEARSVVSMSFRYDSALLNGSLAVSTPEPLRAYLNTYPELGRIEVAGAAGAKLVLTPNFAASSDHFQYALDTNGDGRAEATGSIGWVDSVDGYLWWDGVTAQNSWSSYSTRSFATTDFFASGNLQWVTSSTSAFRLQFSRPPASTTPALFFRFADQGAPVYDGTPYVDIAATAQVHGALVVVRPASPLRHGRDYRLQVSSNGNDWSMLVTVQDALGNSTANYQWNGLSVTTPDSLQAIATAQAGLLGAASDQLSLDGRASRSTPRAIVSYQWSQVSGTPLQFADASAAQTTVSWGAVAPAMGERPVVRLTVTDASGDTDATELTLQSANLGAASRILYFRSAAGDYIGAGATAVYTNGMVAFQESLLTADYFRTSLNASSYTDTWHLDLATGDGSPLRVGAYENAMRAAFRGSQNGLDFSGSGRGCNQVVGRFDVLEFETDGAGTVTRLAVDFEQHCERADAPALLGSFRVNSSVPIRR